MYLGKSGCIRAKVVVFGKVNVVGQKWLYSGKLVLFGQKVVLFGQSGGIPIEWLFSGNVVLFGQSGCIRENEVVFGQKMLYSG